MDKSYDVSDPSDWLETAAPTLAPVETALRCRVCKDFFTTPVITSCSHTFCSLCIRRCLAHDGQCPACRAKDQEVRLRPNWLVQELVEAFQVARPGVLQSARDVLTIKSSGNAGHGKRKHEITDSEDEGVIQRANPRRKTRSQDKMDHDQTEGSIEEGDDPHADDGYIACPICNKKMKEVEVFSHLDVHNIPDEQNHQAQDGDTFVGSLVKAKSTPNKHEPMERLSQLNYSMMTEKDLRKKLASLGIPINGSKAVLVRRHTEWVNLVNANCDEKKSPRRKRDLLKDLEIWERAQDRQVQNSSGSIVMDKDFDGTAWANKHDDDFQRLIISARKQKNIASATESGRDTS